MSSVFVIINESMPVNGTYPTTTNIAFYATEQFAWEHMAGLAYGLGTEDNEPLGHDDTVFYAKVNPEKFEYSEYRIEEHTVRTSE